PQVQAEEPFHGNTFQWRGIERSNTDLVFLLDRSGSVGQAGFEVETGFVYTFLKGFDVAPNATRVAVISFSNDAGERTGTLWRKNCRVTSVGNSRLAVQPSLQNMISSQLLVLVTDGMYTVGPDPVPEANKLKNLGVDIYVFGIGRFLRGHLEKLASTSANVSECESFEVFEKSFGEEGAGKRWDLEDNPRNCDRLCRSPYRGQPDDPGCCDKNAICGCSMTSGTSSCLCGPGFEGSGLGGQCHACRPGTYKEDHDDKTRCKSCPRNSTTKREGSKSLKDCICRKAYVGDPSTGQPCVPVTCPPLQAPEHGSTVGECKTAYDSECQFDCDEGFQLVDEESEVRTCQEDGTWSGATAVCIPKQCDEPRAVANGYLDGCGQERSVGTSCTYRCDVGHRLVGESTTVCTSFSTWTNKGAACEPVQCPTPPTPAYAYRLGDLKSNRTYVYKDTFKPRCMRGFKRDGPDLLVCGANGHWEADGNMSTAFSCVDITKPDIRCPDDLSLLASARRSDVTLTWKQPEVKDNSGEPLIVQQVPEHIVSPWNFPIGSTTIRFRAIDAARLTAECDFTVTVLDKEKPLVTSCPTDIHVNTTDLEVIVTWEEPRFQDNSGKLVHVKQSHKPGSKFTQGSHRIVYTGTDASGNVERCVFQVVVSKSDCPYHPPPRNGALSCDEWLYGQFCQPFCDDRFDFLDKPAEWYICDKDNKWQTEPQGLPVPWPDCAATTLPLEYRKHLTAHYYTGDCTDPRVQETIKKAFQNNYRQRADKTAFCRSGTLCKLDNIKVTCGKMEDDRPPPRGTMTVRHKRSLDVYTAEESDSLAELDAEFFLELGANTTVTNDTEELSSAADEVIDLLGEIEDSVLEEVMTEQNVSFKMALIDFAVGDANVVCAEGQVLNGKECTICPNGTFHDMARDVCAPCPMGTYQDDDGRTSCKLCPNGTSTEAPKSKSLDDCQPPCSEGTYSGTGLGPCVACPQGTYQNKTQQTFCQFCPQGTTTENIGSLHADDCKRYCQPGSYSETGLEPCEPCRIGFYQTTEGQRNCQECRVPTTTLKEGTKSSFDCVEVDHCISAPCKSGTCWNTQHGYLCEP
ncbi:unnamed protein product, partial [Ixodes hexagonus]